MTIEIRVKQNSIRTLDFIYRHICNSAKCKKTVIIDFYYQASKSHLFVIKVKLSFYPKIFLNANQIYHIFRCSRLDFEIYVSRCLQKSHTWNFAHTFLALYTKLDKYNYTIFGNCTKQLNTLTYNILPKKSNLQLLHFLLSFFFWSHEE